MRFVLMYEFLYEVGGLERLMTLHAKFLKKAGHDVVLLFSDIDAKMLKNKTFEGLKILEYGKLKKKGFSKVLFSLMGYNKLKNIIKKDDIIISYSFPINFTIRNLKNKKIFYMNHLPNYLYLPFKERMIWANDLKRKFTLLASTPFLPILRYIDRKLALKSKLILQNSEFTKKRIDKAYKINGTVSYPPVSNEFRPMIDKKIKKKYHVKKDYIFASGRIIPDKRVDWLIEAFSLIKDKDIDLLISGQIDESEREKLEQLAKRLKIEGRVRLLGVVPKEDLIKLYSNAKLYAFPTPKEDFGLVPSEAVSCGTPCVIWADGSGPTEQITHNINGLTAKPYDIQDYARKIDEGLKKKWDKKKILKSAKKFSEQEISKRFMGSILSRI